METDKFHSESDYLSLLKKLCWNSIELAKVQKKRNILLRSRLLNSCFLFFGISEDKYKQLFQHKIGEKRAYTKTWGLRRKAVESRIHAMNS